MYATVVLRYLRFQRQQNQPQVLKSQSCTQLMLIHMCSICIWRCCKECHHEFKGNSCCCSWNSRIYSCSASLLVPLMVQKDLQDKNMLITNGCSHCDYEQCWPGSAFSTQLEVTAACSKKSRRVRRRTHPMTRPFIHQVMGLDYYQESKPALAIGIASEYNGSLHCDQ